MSKQSGDERQGQGGGCCKCGQVHYSYELISAVKSGEVAVNRYEQTVRERVSRPSPHHGGSVFLVLVLVVGRVAAGGRPTVLAAVAHQHVGAQVQIESESY
jgi:hypothetical protein